MNNFERFLYAVLLVILISIFYWLFSQNKDCESKGGVLVRGTMSLQCIDKGSLK